MAHDLFKVTERIYQVRGFDISNITFVEGDTGVIIIDPLTVTETAAAALTLYREHRGNRPVTGMVYTHCHTDHFGGVRGVLNEDDAIARRVPIVAPQGFMWHADEGAIQVDGDIAAVKDLLGMLEDFEPAFNIIEP